MTILTHAQYWVDDIFAHQDTIMDRYGDVEDLKKCLTESSKPATLPNGEKMTFGKPPYVIHTSNYIVALVKEDYSVHRLRFFTVPEDGWTDEESRSHTCTISKLVFITHELKAIRFIPVSRYFHFDTVEDRETIDLSLVEPIFKAAEEKMNKMLPDAKLDNDFLKSVLALQRQNLAFSMLQRIYPSICEVMDTVKEKIKEESEFTEDDTDELVNYVLAQDILTDPDLFTSTFTNAVTELTKSIDDDETEHESNVEDEFVDVTQQVFEQHDADDDGLLDFDEFDALADVVGLGIKKSERKAFFQKIDSGGNGRIDLEEFSSAVQIKGR